MGYVYCVPTNRILEENFKEFCEEARHAVETYQVEIAFVVTDDCIENNNRQRVKCFSEMYKEIPFYYFDGQQMTELLRQILDEFPESSRKRLECLLPRREINYGNTLNREFVLTILLDSSYMLRRDSDVHIIMENGKMLYPVDMEMRYLGKEHEGKVNYIIGSGYRGKWGIDIDDIVMDNDFTLFKSMMQCMDIPEEFLDDIVEDEFIKTRKYEGDNINYQSAAYPQCGNIGYYNLFRALPCSPAADIIATDYFLLETAYEAGLNVGYHMRTVLHRHTKERNRNKQDIAAYWERVSMWIDMELVYKAYIKQMQPVDYSPESIGQCRKYNRYILSYFKNSHIDNEKLLKNREKKFADFIKVILQLKDPVYREVAENLKKEEGRIHDAVTKSLEKHLDLLEIWPDFVERLEKIKGKESIRNKLKGAIL